VSTWTVSVSIKSYRLTVDSTPNSRSNTMVFIRLFLGFNVITQLGTVTAGKFEGNNVVVIISNPIVNPLLCELPVGLHARLGAYTLIIKNLLGLEILNCVGSHTVEYCPGIH